MAAQLSPFKRRFLPSLSFAQNRNPSRRQGEILEQIEQPVASLVFHAQGEFLAVATGHKVSSDQCSKLGVLGLFLDGFDVPGVFTIEEQVNASIIDQLLRAGLIMVPADLILVQTCFAKRAED